MSEKSGFEELMSQVDAIVTHPLTPWLALGVIALFWLMSQVDSKIPEDPIERLKRTFGAEKIPHGIALIGALLWGTLVLTLTFGLIKLLSDIIWNTVQPVEREAKGDFRFLLTKTAALTAVLGAMVALPFTALRLKLTATQTRHAEDVLFNEKLNDANTDLYAIQQVTVPVKDKNGKETHKRETIWQDDVIRRNGAIERLRALAEEAANSGQINNADTINRMLQVYFQETAHPTTAFQSTPRHEDKPMHEEKLSDENEEAHTTLRSDIKSAELALERLNSSEFNRKIIQNAKTLHSTDLENTFKNVTGLSPELERTLKNLSLPSEEIRRAVKSTNVLSPELEKTLKDLSLHSEEIQRTYKNITGLSPELERTLKNLSLPSEEIRRAVESTNVLSPELEKTLKHISLPLTKIQKDNKN
jgi:transcription initiation factor IIF auxiliary subunit